METAPTEGLHVDPRLTPGPDCHWSSYIHYIQIEL